MYSTPVHILGQTFFKSSNIFFLNLGMFFHFFSRSWSELTDIQLNRVRVNEVKLYNVAPPNCHNDSIATQSHIISVAFDYYTTIVYLIAPEPSMSEKRPPSGIGLGPPPL